MVAFTDGYSAVFLATAVILVIASIVGVTLLRGNKVDTAPDKTAPDKTAPDDVLGALSHV